MLRVGVTGGIASGKSTVTRMLRELGAVVVDADQAARAVVEPNRPAWQKIRETFGEQYFLPDGRLDRPKLGQLIFNDERARRKLEAIVHPEVYRVLESEAQKAFEAGNNIVFFDIPLLFETGYQKQLDKAVVVYVDQDTQLKRLINRDRLTEQEAKARISSQMPLSEKAAMADFVIDNTGSVENTRCQVLKLWESLQSEAGLSGKLQRAGEGDLR